MPIDASIPLSVNQIKPLPILENAAQGFQLSALKDEQTQRQQAMQAQQMLKEIYASSNPTTEEGQAQMVQKVSQVDPNSGMKLQEQFMKQKKQQYDVASSKIASEQASYDYQTAKMDGVNQQLTGIYSTYQDAVAKGASPEQAQAQTQPIYQQAINRLQTMTKPDGTPMYSLEELAKIPQNFDPQRVYSGIAASKQGIEMRKQQLAEQRIAETERHNREMEKVRTRQIEAMIQKSKDDGTPLSEEAKNLMAQQLIGGDTSVLTNLGRGAQGAKDVKDIRNRAASMSQKEGLSAGDLRANVAQFQGEKAGARTAATRSANLGIAAQELDKFADISLGASDKVSRTQFVPLNKAVLAVKQGSGSPEVAAFVAANESVINAFAQVAGRGTPTVAGMEHARAMLNTAQTPEQYAAVIKQLKMEAKAALESASEVQSAQRERMGGKTEVKKEEPKSAGLPQGWSVKVK